MNYDRKDRFADVYNGMGINSHGQVRIAKVGWNPDWSGVKALKETEEHSKGYGTYIQVIKGSKSRVLYFEIAPLYGRLWHESMLTIMPGVNRFHDLIPTGYGIFPDIRSQIFYENILDVDHMLDTIGRSSPGYFDASSDTIVYHLRSPKEISALLDIPEDHEMITGFYKDFPGYTDSDSIAPHRYLVMGGYSEYKAVMSNYGRRPRENTQWIFRGMDNRYLRDLGEPYNIPMVGLSAGGVCYPRCLGERILRYMVVPFAFVDFSCSDWHFYPKERSTDVIIPESLPDRYHYPELWHLIAGERCRLLTAGIREADKEFVFTHDGNIVPLDCFDIV